MKELEIIDLYNHTDSEKIKRFNQSLNSSLNVQTDYDKTVCNFEWLDMMEETIIYLDNILRNPNRFIVNEEEVVKIELARRITVESIKHLAKNTNFIQDYDKKTGDVRPSKILNINKDESFNTYENRFIYTLISNMKSYVALKKSTLKTASTLKDLKIIEYNATSRVGQEKVDININVNSSINEKSDDGIKDGKTIEERLEFLEMRLNDLSNTEVYRSLQKAHVALVMSPIKKTNVILKNTNFQYAVRLWNYLQSHIDDETKREKDNKTYKENGKLKDYIDDSGLLSYLALTLLSKDNNQTETELTHQETEAITNSLIDKIVALNSDMPDETLQQMIGKKVIVSKQKNTANIKEIQNIIDEKIDKYILKINEFKF